MEKLAKKYLCLDPPETQPEYNGNENEELDRPITLGELEAELTSIKKTAAPGPDAITAKHVYNMDERTLEELVQHFNDNYWTKGITPDNWKKQMSDLYLSRKKS